MTGCPKITMSQISRRVGLARKDAGYKQEEFAKMIGLKHRQTLSAIERGQRKIKPDELIKVMELTDKDLDFFSDPFRLDEEPQFHFHVSENIYK